MQLRSYRSEASPRPRYRVMLRVGEAHDAVQTLKAVRDCMWPGLRALQATRTREELMSATDRLTDETLALTRRFRAAVVEEIAIRGKSD